MGYTGGGVKYRCEIGSAPSPSPPWQPACRSPSTASCARLEAGRALSSTLSSSPCPTLHSPFSALFPPRSTPAPPRPSPSASQPGQEHQSRTVFGGPGTGTPEAQGSALVPHPGGPKFLQLFPAAVPTARSQGHCGPPGLPPSRSSPSPRRLPILAPRVAPAPSRRSLRKLPRGTFPRPPLN